jgi:hypothetical protein
MLALAEDEQIAATVYICLPYIEHGQDIMFVKSEFLFIMLSQMPLI